MSTLSDNSLSSVPLNLARRSNKKKDMRALYKEVNLEVVWDTEPSVYGCLPYPDRKRKIDKPKPGVIVITHFGLGLEITSYIGGRSSECYAVIEDLA